MGSGEPGVRSGEPRVRSEEPGVGARNTSGPLNNFYVHCQSDLCDFENCTCRSCCPVSSQAH